MCLYVVYNTTIASHFHFPFNDAHDPVMIVLQISTVLNTSIIPECIFMCVFRFYENTVPTVATAAAAPAVTSSLIRNLIVRAHRSDPTDPGSVRSIENYTTCTNPSQSHTTMSLCAIFVCVCMYLFVCV